MNRIVALCLCVAWLAGCAIPSKKADTPSDSDAAILAIADAAVAAGNFPLAEGVYRSAGQREPDNADLALNHAKTLYVLGNYTQSADAFATALRLKPDPLTASRLIAVWVRAGNLPAAEQAAQTALAQYPTSENIRINAALVQLVMLRPDVAIAVLESHPSTATPAINSTLALAKCLNNPLAKTQTLPQHKNDLNQTLDMCRAVLSLPGNQQSARLQEMFFND